MVTGTVVGAYRVLHQIGEGGMGSVWLAEHAMLGRRAAIKMLHAEFSGRPEIVARFFNEARAATAIGDPGIVQIFDFGHHIDGSAYIVMELLDGEPLDRRLGRLGALAVDDALRIMRQVASALGAAHARGIVHRDLKPENIYLVRDPEVPGGERPKVLDFGIAKLVGDRSGVKTNTSAVMGTPTYMSPEQCRGSGQVDQRSDVYALGCLLFRVLCGRPPFDADGVGDIIAMHLRESPPVPSIVRPGLPAEIDQLVLCCLAKDPSQRFGSGTELALALGALLGVSPPIAAPPRARVAATPTTLSAAIGTGPSRSGGPSRTVAVGVAAAGAAIAVAIVVSRGGSDEPRPVAAPAAAAVVAAPEAPAPAPPPDPNAEVLARTKVVLSRFVAWARDHRGAPCPDAATLGVDLADPWGQAFRLTCTDQPGDQIAGVVSSGPDRVAGTADDLASWQLGRDVTDLVRGPRWVVAPAAAGPTAGATPAVRPPPPRPRRPPSALKLDEYGLPITR